MNDIKSINEELYEISKVKQDFEKKYSDMIVDFLNGAYELVELSEDLYQVEHSIQLNKISLKDYVLNSDICNMLKENNISDYSIEELKDYMNKIENQNITNVYPYKLALDLYEKLEEIERKENEKINYEMNELSKWLDITIIKTISKEEYQDLYNKLLTQVRESYVDTNIIDDKINNSIVQMLNDIFNYYLYGNKEIPVSIEYEA